MATKALMKTLLEDDPRYQAMFAIEAEMANSGVDLDRDYTADMNALRSKAAVQKGSLRELLGLPEVPGGYGVPRQGYTFFSYRACETGFRENLRFSSEGYNDSPGLQAIGPTILQMVGKPHKRARAVAQPLFKRPKVLSWWNKRWIEETVNALLDRLLGQNAIDLNVELCARLPMATVTRAIGLEGADALTFRYHLTRSTFGARNLPAEEAAASRAVVDAMLRDLIAHNLKEPGDNVITGLLTGDLSLEGGGARKLNEKELFAFCKLLIFAGGGTTWRQLGITIDALLSHYPFWEACRDDRSLLEQAVDESLRWRATDPVFPRLCVGSRLHRPPAAVDYKAADFADQLKTACPNGIDVCVDNVGGAVTLSVLPLMKYRARMPVCGFIAYYGMGMEGPGPDHLPGFMRMVMSKGLEVRGFGGFMVGGPQALEDIASWIREGRLAYPEAIVEGLESAPAAFAGVFSGNSHVGKLLVRVASD